ncbi:endonuclease [Deinococcus irradiatisoli]|uniref:Endonuclease n=1 Tax=Deinococcus irradiatisoli TaxID=2202254 RepID=A0A2Z3JE07_9DEIO|nr:ExeM/NucH family extracellular endonuclease [Deinococcus irradiatisoli]AWN23195.1 endonuclease [Deinococcus irradiatisoli]
MPRLPFSLAALTLITLGLSACTSNAATPEAPYGGTRIHDIQGATPAGDVASPKVGEKVEIEAVVVGVFPGLSGYAVQEADSMADQNPNTSEGLFVYCGSVTTCGAVKVGDRVKVSGTIKEFSKGTQLDTVTAETVVASGLTLPKAVTVTLPQDGNWEKYEGMRLNFPQTLTVTDNYSYGRYGQLGLSAGGRLFNPTNGNDTSTQAANDARKIVIDDGVSAQNPASLPYLSAQQTRRTGDTVAGVSGVWVQNAGGYMLEPVATPVFTAANPRPNAPQAVGGTLRVAGANVLNYFNDLNPDYSSTGPRGANSAGEFERQQAKIVAALKGLNADILTLMEVENNGDTALQALVDALNKEMGAGTYAAVKTGTVGSDAIKVAIIYKPASVTPQGAAQIDTDAVYSRPPVAQTFKDKQGGVLTVVANHLKSKGSCDNTDPDLGQGCWNLLRVQQAGALLKFVTQLKTQSGDPDVLLMGDFNAYGDEDPIKAITAAGFESLNKRIPAAERYSYQFSGQFGYLDHALASSSLGAQVTGITEWHINSDEPTVADYNYEYKNVPGCVVNTPKGNTCTGQDLFGPGPFRASDHDPVLVGLNLTK